MTHPSLLTKSAFARSQGWSASYVTKLKDEGRLVLEGVGRAERIKVAESLALIAATAGGREDVSARHAHGRGRENDTGGGEAPPAATGKTESKAIATSRKESAQADMAEMERDLMRGNVVKRADIETSLTFIGTALRGLLEKAPGQYAAGLAPLTDTADVEDALDLMCRDILAQFGDAIARQRSATLERAPA